MILADPSRILNPAREGISKLLTEGGHATWSVTCGLPRTGRYRDLRRTPSPRTEFSDRITGPIPMAPGLRELHTALPMEPGNTFFGRSETGASLALNVLIVYDNRAAGQRAMRLYRDLACQQAGELSLRPRLWRLDVVVDPVCSGFAIADAVNADLLMISTSGQSALSPPAQHWLKLCLALARKRGTSVAMIALVGTASKINETDFLTLQFLRRSAEEAGLDFFTPSANGMKPDAEAPRLEEGGPLAVRQSAKAYQPAMLRAYGQDTKYREWGIND